MESHVCMESHVIPCDMMERFQKFSSWFRLQRAIAICQKYVEKLKTCDAAHYSPVYVTDMDRAKLLIIRTAQGVTFPNEIRVLRVAHTTQVISSKSPIFQLDPFLDDKCLLRVGGRAKRCTLSMELKFPILLPQRCHVSILIIEHYHRDTGHAGRGITLNRIQQAGFWILKARTAVTLLIKDCILCRKLRGNSCGQKMADLPTDRLDSIAPFTYSGVDYFGPFLIKEGRCEIKRWGVLFTCLASRSIHIETAISMDTDSFLNAYRRFVCRRGPIRLLRCDRGSNFIGGRNDLDAALAEMDKDKLKQELLKDGRDFVTFEMNFPHSSHMGGVWERMIGAARNALSGLLLSHGTKLNDELLRTLLVEAEAIVNSRPLTYVEAESPDSPEPLSPSQLLTLKAKVVLPPPGVFEKTDLYCRRRWRRVQALANEFWVRWRREFLPTLQERKKWNRQQVNVTKGDVVMMIDETAPRCDWPLARIVEMFPGEDGLVRKVKIRTGQGTVYERPIQKLVLLFKPDEPEN
ncbi:uncharacterized protein LOC135496078 [Lineus longissimus]|uniref:uncharacterized protein LOC135496078 n=1 Tax=Lineus longissimus TaxID=88925 RepID=UPI00315CAE67